MRYLIAKAFIVIFIFCGCATIPEPNRPSIETAYQQINVSDGISMEEAITISQRFMLRNNFEADWYVSKPKQAEMDSEGKNWRVIFKPKNDGWGNGPRHGIGLTLELLAPKIISVNLADGSVSMMTMKEENGKILISNEKQ